jgi:hypothetical protein
VVASQRLRNLPNQARLSILSFSSLPLAALKASVVDVLVKLFITLGNAHQSFINLPVAQSNTAICQFVAELGHNTSQAHSQSAQSIIVN